jgi:GAF domain-containing protein
MEPTVASPGSGASRPSAASSDHSASLSELQRLLLISRDLESFLKRVAVLTATAMPPGGSCAIAVEPPARPVIVVGSDEGSLAVGQIECTHDEGPCVEVRHTGRAVYVPDLTRERRWAFGIEALAHGIRSLLAVPIQGSAGVMGVLSMYDTRAHAYGEEHGEHGRYGRQRGRGENSETLIRAQAFGETIADVIAIALELADQVQLNEDLQKVLASRSVIDQALGVIMAENRCDREQAFDILRRASQNRNTKLHEIAAGLILSVTGRQPEPGPFCPRR